MMASGGEWWVVSGWLVFDPFGLSEVVEGGIGCLPYAATERRLFNAVYVIKGGIHRQPTRSGSSNSWRFQILFCRRNRHRQEGLGMSDRNGTERNGDSTTDRTAVRREAVDRHNRPP